jgi:signal transduction histidine kinase
MFLSGAVERPNVRRGMEMGADDYLTKPFTPSELLAAVNARLEKQAELQRKNEKKLDELRGKMTLALPHELRTPLNGIMGLSAILIEDHGKLKPDEVLESARYIHQSAMRLHRLIENFLAYGQIELMAKDAKSILAGAAACATPVESLVRDTAREVAARFQREADLRLNLAPAKVAVIEDNFRKIVEEIVDNAFKFSETGTPVTVTAAAAARQFTLSIANRGRGMTPEQIAGIAPHAQFEREHYEQQGAGLGLIIAKRLTELNGGRFEIVSVPGHDTTVSMHFPARID